MGGYERNPAPWALDGVPDGFEAQLLPEDWPRFEPLLEAAVERVPAMETAEVRKLFNGPEAFTPDGEFILGESDVPGFWVAAGFCAHGLAGAGGMGWQVAEWVVNGEPSLDLWHMDSRRFGRQYRSRDYTLARATEVYSTYYDIKYPNHERTAGPAAAALAGVRAPGRARRELRREVGLGAARTGSSRTPPSATRRCGRAAGRARTGRRRSTPRRWRRASGRGSSTRRRSPRSRSPARAPPPTCSGCARTTSTARSASVTYTQMLNSRGGIECDFTVTRLAERGSGSSPAPPSATTTWAGSAATCPATGRSRWPTSPRRTRASGCGGRARATSCSRSRRPTSPNAGLPYMRAAEISVGHVPCLAVRVTYVGELGWELYCPTEYGAALWDAIWESGRGHGMLAAGYRAIDALRIEKGYRVWGADITPEDSPDEAGLGLRGQARQGRRVHRPRRPPARPRGGAAGGGWAAWRCADPAAVTLGSEPVRVGGEVAGRVTSGGYGFAVGRSLAYAYLPAAAAAVGTAVEVEVFGDWVAAEVVAEPVWDPRGERIRG